MRYKEISSSSIADERRGKNSFLSSPDLASVSSFNVEEHDIIVIATDGLWDNLPDATILEEISKIRVSVPFIFERWYRMA